MNKEVVGSSEMMITDKIHIFTKHQTVICILLWEMNLISHINLISHKFSILSVLDVVSKLTASLFYLTTLAG